LIVVGFFDEPADEEEQGQRNELLSGLPVSLGKEVNLKDDNQLGCWTPTAIPDLLPPL
jgi:hypothetical protein